MKLTVSILTAETGLLCYVHMKARESATITLEMNRSDTVKMMKMKIQEKENIPIAKQQLAYTGTVLKNNQTLGSYNLETISSLDLIISEESRCTIQ